VIRKAVEILLVLVKGITRNQILKISYEFFNRDKTVGPISNCPKKVIAQRGRNCSTRKNKLFILEDKRIFLLGQLCERQISVTLMRTRFWNGCSIFSNNIPLVNACLY
jgi:hypothetical protein